MNFNKQYLIHGFLPAFFSACFFAVMVTCIKATSSELPTIQLVFLRSIIGLIIIAILTDTPRGCEPMRIESGCDFLSRDSVLVDKNHGLGAFKK